MTAQTATQHKLAISSLQVSIEGRQIVHGIDLVIKGGELHALMGPNGSGKSTLTYALMGHPHYQIVGGKALLDRKNLLRMPPHQRAKLGLMLAFQNPITVTGVTLSSFLRTAYRQIHGATMSILELQRVITTHATQLSLNETFLRRSLNDGFSGGEKKKAEILQLLVLKPKIAIFDEIDTGLDIDALKVVAAGIELMKKAGVGILLITHYQRILKYVRPDRVHVMMGGKIVKDGGPTLAQQIEEHGYATI